MTNEQKPSRRSLTAQALGWLDEPSRGLVPAIHTSTNYKRGADGSYPGGSEYGRDANPTYRQAESLLAELEGGTEARLFASGMAAATAVVDGLGSGPRVVAQTSMYWAFRRWLEEGAKEGRLDLELVPNADEAALGAALEEKTDLVWLETPANPMLEITDLRRFADMAHSAGAMVAVDNTLATPVHTNPLALGVDLVMHSATKQLNGHGDVLAGALVVGKSAPSVWESIKSQRVNRGGILGPFEAWLLQRGMRTLFLRVPASSSSALEVARGLKQNSAVREVFYPGLEDHPSHDVAVAQMKGGFGCMVSFRVDSEESARRVERSTRLIVPATSLGGTESLIEHRASIEGEGSPVPQDLLRLAIGLEDPQDLLADLEQALAGI